MVARTYTTLKAKNGILHRYEFGEVEVSQSDTVTLSGFDTAQNLLTAYVWNKNGGAEVTCTKALNVITITGAGTNMDCLFIAYGYKA